jgi:FHA domain-containing protein
VRYRLRFLLQEFDLPLGTTIVGRSLDCHLTIEDPLVSREHARITIDDDGARLEDLRSRNGVRVNGLVVREPTLLRDGDRVRIGTQDLVFCRVGSDGRSHSKTTGVLRLCANCRLPYPREIPACPHCEAIEQTDEVTLTDGSEEHRAAWNVQLLLETLERALVLGRMADAERLVRRAKAQLDEMLSSGRLIDAHAVGAVAAKVAAMTLVTNDPSWVLWVLDLYMRTSLVPSREVADRLAEVAPKHAQVVRGPFGALLEHLRAAVSVGSDEEVEAMARLEGTRRLVEQERGQQPQPHDNVRNSSETTKASPVIP